MVSRECRIPAAPETIRRKASARYGYKPARFFFAGLLKARFAAIVFAMILRNALENPSEL